MCILRLQNTMAAIGSLLVLAGILLFAVAMQRSQDDLPASNEAKNLMSDEGAGGHEKANPVRDVRGSEFVDQDLTGAVFDRCSLYGVRLDNCILKDASFRGAVFVGASVDNCDFENADFTGASINGFSSMLDGDIPSLMLSPEQLMSTRSYATGNLYACKICGSWTPIRFDFRRADLRHTKIVNGDFTESDFAKARIHGATFENFTISFDQLASTFSYRQKGLHVHIGSGGPDGEGLTGAWDFSGVSLRGSELLITQPNTDFTGAEISGCTLRGRFTKEQLYSTRSYRERNLTYLALKGIDLTNCDLSGMNLTGARFDQCTFTGADLDDAVITSVDFSSDPNSPDGCIELTADQIKSTWNYKHSRMAMVGLPGHLKHLQETAKTP